ncbi:MULTISPECIES: TetR/AcrR family transcriptional regulator [unclassified Streptomyces]|uniref:TetR/AcrR family transcriptional regulator n=1 Tax=unclassified Streptomyces TaxID=2593676 RepID=UPI00278C1AAE|nr:MULTISPECIES: TetR/AcrR family transcriptional regulator [unclassified Streptomyces]
MAGSPSGASASASAAKRKPRGAKSLSPDQIIEVATRICDEEDVDVLTIRRLASELGVGPMTLYSYFRSKEEILDGIADHVMGKFRLPSEDVTAPADVVRSLAWAFLGMMREHPSIVRLFSTRVNTGPESMRGAFDSVIGQLRAVGFADHDAVRAYGMILQYTLGFASYQAPRSWGKPDHPDVEELRRQRTHFYAGLPREGFSNMVDLAAEITTLPSDDQFRFGLDCLAEGLVRRSDIAD